MKFSVVALVAAVGLANAQTSDIPSCAIKCLTQNLSTTDCKSIADVTCICKNIDNIMTSGAKCFQDSCKSDELQKAQDAAKSLCNAAVSATGSDSTSATGTDSASATGTDSKSGTDTKTATATATDTASATGTNTATTGKSSTETGSKTSGSESATGTSSAAATSSTEAGNAAKPMLGAGVAMAAALLAL